MIEIPSPDRHLSAEQATYACIVSQRLVPSPLLPCNLRLLRCTGLEGYNGHPLVSFNK